MSAVTTGISWTHWGLLEEFAWGKGAARNQPQQIARDGSMLVTETQQAQTDKLVWSPDTQKACKVLQTALLQAPTLNCPQGQNLICLSLKEKVWPWEF